jgi:glutathione S-transferase
MKKFARDNLEKRLGWLNGALGSKNFLMGDTFTVADAYLYVVIGWLSRVGIDLAQWPNLKRLHERVGARPSVIAAMKGEGLIK